MTEVVVPDAAAPPRLTVAVTGSRGLIGSALVRSLQGARHSVLRLVRGESAAADAVTWDARSGRADVTRLEGVEALIHLAGESLVGRWTPARMAEIRRSRVEGTQRLAEALAGLRRPPRVLVAASAVGYYGDRGAEWLDEASAPGSGFLASVVREWEAAAAPAARAGIRTVHARFGMVLSPAGGALRALSTLFRLGLGGRLGSGEQFISWIAIDDAVGALEHLLDAHDLRGPVNVVSPLPVTNAAFTRTLARALSRPALIPVPAFAARLLLGTMADELLLASQRVVPRRMEQAGYRFRYPRLEAALQHLLHGA